MINEEKVKSMTKAAAYENSAEKKNIEISGYFRKDYLGLQLIKSAFAYGVAFVLLTVLWLLGRGEELMLQLSHPDYLQGLLTILLIIFVAGLLVYEIAVYIYYSWKHNRAVESVSEFQAYLKTIHKFYEKEESAGKDYTVIELSDEENT